MSQLQDLSIQWMLAKDAEKNAVEVRRLIEDEMVHLLEIQQGDEGTKSIQASPFAIKVVSRVTRKVDGDKAQEIAAENDMQDYLSLLFRWKPELSMTTWNGVGDNVKQVFAHAITTTPGRPSFTITKEK